MNENYLTWVKKKSEPEPVQKAITTRNISEIDERVEFVQVSLHSGFEVLFTKQMNQSNY